MKKDDDSEKRHDKPHTENMQYTAGRPRILLAEDDTEMRRMLALQMRNAGFDVIEIHAGLCCVSQVLGVL